MNALLIILVIISSLSLFVLILSYMCFRGAFYNNFKKKNGVSVLKGAEFDEYHDSMQKLLLLSKTYSYEEVYVKSVDGLMLYGRYYEVDKNAPVTIGFHGYKGTGARDLASSICEMLNMGQNVLIVDQRGHGKSQGKTISFGIKERYDVISWINFVTNRFGKDKKIILYGVSMGAETVLMASAFKLPKNVVCIIADCPYSSPKEIVMKVVKEMKVSTKFMYPFFIIGARLYGGFNLNETDAIESVKKSNVPILLFHGKLDSFVPYEMSERIANANTDKIHLEIFPKARHGSSYYSDKNRYLSVYKNFVKNCT